MIVSWLFKINDDGTSETNGQINTFLKGRLSGLTNGGGGKSTRKTQSPTIGNDMMSMTVMVEVAEAVETSYDISLKGGIQVTEEDLDSASHVERKGVVFPEPPTRA